MRFLLVAGLLAAGGCVYYNGMYKARRLADQAEKAERQGRRFDAQNYWAQAEIKADTVISRHATSSWADDAMLIKGTALSRRNACDQAVPYLERVVFTSPDSELVEQASVLLGDCYLQMDDPLAAVRYLATGVSSQDSARQMKARGLYGTALNSLGEYQEAMAVLEPLGDPRMDGARAVAMAGAGHVGAAEQLSDSLIARRDTVVDWNMVLAAIGWYDAASATALTDRVIAGYDSLNAETVARFYLEDGLRWVDLDPDRAVERLVLAAADTSARRNGGLARIEIIRLELRRSATPEDLSKVHGTLEVAAVSPGADGLIARRLQSMVVRMQSADSLTAGTPNGDMHLFFLAEVARDSLEAPQLAQWFFRELTVRWPDSPFAPKAVLAMAVVDPDNAPLYHGMLTYAYAGSPYLAYLEGDVSPAYLSLEDSLRGYAMSQLVGQQQPQEQRRRSGRQGRARTDIDDMNPEDVP
jgi:predicted negative regulator of RcsB-dependent stress response